MNNLALTAKHTIDDSYNTHDDGTTNTGTTGTVTASTGTSGSSWNWGAFWNAFTHLGDTAANVFGRPQYSNYPQQYPQQSTISPLVTYGILAVVVLLALALMVKILK